MDNRSGHIEDADLKPKKGIVREWAKAIGLALALALIIRSSVVSAYWIPTGSMEDTLKIGDYFFATKFQYGFRMPFTDKVLFPVFDFERGDVIVFDPPFPCANEYVKRVIGLPGDRLQIVDKKVWINGRRLNEPYIHFTDRFILPGGMEPRDNYGPVIVPAGKLFVMGDNRDNSYDSRYWGYVDQSQVKGKAQVRLWSIDKEHGAIRWSRTITWIY
jgi:signal peptidase I